MIDREKVIKGLEYCIADEYCDECPYTDDCFAIDDKPYGEKMLRDALELLKEQQNRIDVLHSEVKRLDEDIVRCKDCKKLGYTNSHWFCKWLNRCVDEDWFCADGERK